MKSNEYNTMKINKQRSVSNIRNEQHVPIRITPEKVCMRNQEICFFNATKVCNNCVIATGDTNLEILFQNSPWKPPINETTKIPEKVSLPEIEQEKLLKPPIPEPIKVAPIEEDAEDIPHFVNHVSESIIHQHSGNTVLHKHFPVYGAILGTNCSVCNFPVYGVNYCPGCSMIIEE